jgi:hypothetical protein
MSMHDLGEREKAREERKRGYEGRGWGGKRKG